MTEIQELSMIIYSLIKKYKFELLHHKVLYHEDLKINNPQRSKEHHE